MKTAKKKGETMDFMAKMKLGQELKKHTVVDGKHSVLTDVGIGLVADALGITDADEFMGTMAHDIILLTPEIDGFRANLPDTTQVRAVLSRRAAEKDIGA